jgi:hypothetical protein
MANTTHPSKEQVRQYMRDRVDAQRADRREPPPSRAEIRRRLGWGLVPGEPDDQRR